MTKELAGQYEKTRAYIRGWVDFLEGNPSQESIPEYGVGFKNAENWLNN